MRIELDDLSRPEIAELLKEHLASMFLVTPPESVHALPIEKLRSPKVTFWSAWENGELLGCGALQELDPQHGEVKAMRTVSRHLRKGVARAILDHIIKEAKRRGLSAPEPGDGFYGGIRTGPPTLCGAGFVCCEPFAYYRHDPKSVFMTMKL